MEGCNTLEVTHDDDSAGRIPTEGINDSWAGNESGTENDS